jgi:hypothetical protein
VRTGLLLTRIAGFICAFSGMYAQRKTNAPDPGQSVESWGVS